MPELNLRLSRSAVAARGWHKADRGDAQNAGWWTKNNNGWKMQDWKRRTNKYE